MQFVYQARDQQGRIREGEVAALDSVEAVQQVRQDGLYPIAVREKTNPSSSGSGGPLRRRVSRTDVIYFTNQLAVLIDAGVPLSEALDGLGRQTENPTLRVVLLEVQKYVQSGDDLSSALARFPRLFDRTYVNLIRASEVSGTMGLMLDRISAQARSELETKQKVKGALMYPAAMLLMCIGVSIFLLVYVFPKLEPMFAVKKMEIPAPTRVMMFLSNSMTSYWYWILVGFAVLTAFVVYALKQPWGRRTVDWTALHLPILGPMMQKVILGRSLRTLATTINAGVPVLEALELSAAVANNHFYEVSWSDVGEQVTGGKQIHEALAGKPLFPPTVQQMISSGEATGRLGDILNKVSDYYEREIANAIKAATSLIEPVMVFLMGGVIGTIALAMLLPIFKLSGSPH